MPQLDITTFASQLFWLFVTFSLFYLIMCRVILPRISSTIFNREEYINNNKNIAASAKEELSELEAEYDERVLKMREEYNIIVTKAKESARIESEKEISENHKILDKKFEQEIEKINQKFVTEETLLLKHSKKLSENIFEKII